MRKSNRHIFSVLIVLLVVGCCGLSAEEPAWKTVKKKHFLVNYVDDKAFAEKVGHESEKLYKRIARDIGYTKHDNFWLWGDRAVIYLYATREKFVTATGAPKWAAGKAVYADRTILSYQGSDVFLQTVLPHELTHLIFREFVGFKGEVPLWLNEGIAQWEETEKRKQFAGLLSNLKKQKKLISLDSLTNVKTVKTANGPQPEFYKDTGKALTYYAHSASVVGFLIEKYGADRFKKFCIQLRDGKNLNDALRIAYPQVICDTQKLEKAWVESLK